ncbi:hypothetical protein [Enhygromyxa salina]|uniref:Uncharacterized protein n=1 Tax=Enhygromyxa salina TaxID=215803 RepID=A0A2S9XVF4_9BACT|nr:hypothetical protein [Enhygromyxa salina]PRP96720.1 hypothetical protein ENSA7_67880 [Enhygromyxa salina]
MSLPARASLAIALAWAGGFGVLGRWGLGLGGLVVLVAVGLAIRHRPDPGGGQGDHADRECHSDTASSAPARARSIARSLALVLALVLLARTLGRVIIASPASLWALPLVGLALSGSRPRLVATTLITALALLAGLAGSRYELAGDQPHGMVHSGPIIGIHPRQAIAVRIDGFGPHDIVVDDFVDPPGGLGYDPARWAERLELELHSIAETRYADGPARARQAFAGAEVRVIDAIVPPAERPAYPSLLGIEVRSGTTGAGSRVEFGCPGQPTGPHDRFESSRACPRKYLVDGSTGLGLSPRWPGYTAFAGRDRVRLARWIDWPAGAGPRGQPRLAVESGAWLVIVVLGGWLVARRWGGRATGTIAAATTLAGLALLGGVLVAASSSGGSGSAGGGALSLLAIALVLIPDRSGQPSDRSRGSGRGSGRRSARRSARGSRVLAIACAASLLLVSVSPIAGHGDAIALLEALAEQLAQSGRITWESSRALAGSLSVVALGAGVGICVHALVAELPVEPRERRHTPELVLLGLVLAAALALSLRKPGDDLALLHGAAAVLMLATARLRGDAGPAK